METKDKKIDVLDSGFVRLVDSMGSDLSVVRAARVSYAADWRAGVQEGSDRRLIKYLWKNKHTSPFEAVTFTFEVKAPIFVFRQWHRHRTMSFNEVSARYTELDMGYYVPDPVMIGKQSTHNKQQRDVSSLTDEEFYLREGQVKKYIEFCAEAEFMYHKLIDQGWPRELARMVLPLSTYSRMFVTVNLLNLLKFIGLRDHDHAQHEIRVYAQVMKELITDVAPACVEAFDEGN